MVHQIEARTYVTTDILEHEYEYTFGDRKSKMVDFTFVNVKTGKETTKKQVFTYTHAISLARERRNDKRYKNYEFVIGL